MVLPLTERIERPSAETTPAVTVDSQIPRTVGAQQRQIGIGIGPEHARVGDDAFDVAQADLFRGSDHMAVGQHQSVRRDDDAGTEPAALARVTDLRPGLDADHGGTDAFGHADHGVGIGVQQGFVVILGAFDRPR